MACRSELEELTGVVRGRVAIGAMWPTGNYDLAGTLATFHQRHPGVEIHMVEETADRLLEMLRADELDCAFASVDPDRLGDEFAATMLFEEQFVVAFAAGHPFSELEHVTFAQLADQALIAYREGSELRRRLRWAMADHDLSRATRSSAPRWPPSAGWRRVGSGPPCCRSRSRTWRASRSSSARSARSR